MSEVSQYWRCWCTSLVVGGILVTSFQEYVFAQITRDNTLPNNSIVTPDGSTLKITGGTQAGRNLFHSFSEFSVPTGGTASFNNAADIQNIISRVTGGSASNIDGIIRANGTANLFLINPSGVIFGKNASLRIGGSFVGSTASSLNFADGTQFSATAPQTAPLLTVSVPIGLQYEGNAADIQNQSRATNNSSELVGLQVLPGRTLALVGGNVGLDGGSLNAQGGRVEIAGVAGPGAVGLFVDGNSLRLSFPNTVARANVYLDNSAEVNVRASGGGSIAINAQNLNLTQGSKLEAGMSGLGLGDAKAGDIEINSTGNVSFNGQGSGAYNQVESNAIGNAGNINVKAVSLSVTNGGELNTSTTGQGNAGNVNVNASDTVSFVGESPNNISSRVYSRVEKTGVGQGGDIYIKTGSLLVSDGAFLSTNSNGQGNAGNVTINARDTVSIVGGGPPADKFFPSGVYTQSNKEGQGGNIYISAGSLEVTGGAFLSARTLGKGDAGNVTINARDKVSFNGVGRSEVYPYLGSGAYTQVDETGVGQAGDIYISAGSLEVTGGAYLSASTLGEGDAGNITINARDKVSFDGVGTNGISSGAYTQNRKNVRGQGGNVNITTGSLSVTNGAQLNTSTRGQGNAGNVTIDARDTVSFVGESPNNISSGAFTRVEKTGVGQGGDIYIKTGSLLVSDGAFLNTNSNGQGNAGNVTIDARDIVSIVGGGPPADKFFPSGVYTQSNNGARGQGGDIYISAGSLEVTGGALLSARTLGIGDAGNVTINARDKVSFNGVGRSEVYPYLNSGAYSQVDETGVGQAGDVYISAGSLEVTGGAYLSAGTLGKGNAGNVTINARDKVSFDGVGTNGISSGAYGQPRFFNTQGQGGNVNITAGSLFVTNGANLSSSTYGQKNAGNININVRDLVSFDGVATNGISSRASSRVEKDAGGNGGSINIKTGSLFVTNGAGLFVSSFGQGGAGDLIINARNTVRLDNQSRIRATTIVGNKGNISLHSQNLVLSRGSDISTNATGENAIGGNINIDTDFLIAFENSDISANSQNFRGGNVQINAFGIFGTQFRDVGSDQTSDITARGASSKLSGNVELNTPGIDPNSGLVELPTVPVDTQVAQGCYSPGYAQNRFVITGRGGLPANPKDILTPDAPQIDWVSLKPSNNNRSLLPITSEPTTSTPKRIVEATGAVLNAKGQIVLSANSSTATHPTSRQNPIQCHGS